MPNISLFQFLNCDDLLLFSVLYSSKSNIVGFKTVGQANKVQMSWCSGGMLLCFTYNAAI